MRLVAVGRVAGSPARVGLTTWSCRGAAAGSAAWRGRTSARYSRLRRRCAPGADGPYGHASARSLRRTRRALLQPQPSPTRRRTPTGARRARPWPGSRAAPWGRAVAPGVEGAAAVGRRPGRPRGVRGGRDDWPPARTSADQRAERGDAPAAPVQVVGLTRDQWCARRGTYRRRRPVRPAGRPRSALERDGRRGRRCATAPTIAGEQRAGERCPRATPATPRSMAIVRDAVRGAGRARLQ